MRKKKYLFWLLFHCSVFTVFGQTKLTGKVVDAETKQSLPFANIVTMGTPAVGTTTDIDGHFFINCETISQISCSFVGYDKQTITVKGLGFLTIELQQSHNILDEVVITPQENPAKKIIRKVIANKAQNNPEKMNSFRYRSYNKIIYDYQTRKDQITDSLALSKRFKASHLFMMESVTERKYLNPDYSEEKIIGTKVSGFQNPAFATLATDIQPFSFYLENIKLFGIQYLNPIANGSLDRYQFHIEETIPSDKDTTYIISFKPLAKKNFEGLKGLLYINSNKYAIQNVIASPSQKQKIDIKIHQQYVFDGQYWFPEQLNFVASINDVKHLKISINGKSYLTDIVPNVKLTRADFPIQSVTVATDAGKKDAAFWNETRPQPLTATELMTYKVIDSIGKKKNFDAYAVYMEAIAQNRFPLKYIDIDLSKTLLYNEYESLRMGTGFYTNDNIFKNVKIGGFYGVGLQDSQSKYGGEIIFKVRKASEVQFRGRFQDNYIETGSDGLQNEAVGLFNFRRFLGYQYDRIQQSTIGVNSRIFKYVTVGISLSNTKTSPQYDYQFITAENTFSNYTNSHLDINLRFAFKEKIVSIFNQNMAIGSKYPVFNLWYSKGFNAFLNSDLTYHKVQLKMEHAFFTKNFGTTKYILETGMIDRAIPYGLLFTGEGSASNASIFIVKNYFQTMKPYEFLSDKYFNVFLSHNFGGLLFKKNQFQPEITIHNNLGWGNLSDENAHQAIAYKVKNKVFMEGGLQVYNVIKMNYLNIANIGFGTAVFCKYGAYAQNKFDDNLTFKFTANLTIK